jgi:quinol monooxygenase YgiN
MLVIFRTRGEDWERFRSTLRENEQVLRDLGCTRVEAYRNRKHLDEWVMVQDWPDKATFDAFARESGPALDRQAGVRWTDVSTWQESAL